MNIRNIIIFFAIHYCGALYAQTDSIQHVKEVILFGNQLQVQSIGHKEIKINQDQIVDNPTNFTETLRYNSPISFKDYGNGGVSTAVFRGTSATNTMVLWNGLSINSVGNGQTDFNGISASTYDGITVSSGGASAFYGSGAIGGVVMINDDLNFNKHLETSLFSSYGSFNTSSNFIKSNYGNNKVALKLGTSYNCSINDYPYIDRRYKDEKGNSLKNENGEYQNFHFNLGSGYCFNKYHKLFFYSSIFKGSRNYSDGLPNPSAGSEKNIDVNQRYLFKYVTAIDKLNIVVKNAYLMQEYRYFNDIESTNFSYGKSNELLSGVEFQRDLGRFMSVDFRSQYQYIQGTTDTSIMNNPVLADAEMFRKVREVFSQVASLKYNYPKGLIATMNWRYEKNTAFSVPMIYSFSANQKLKFLKLFGNYSTNYRVPTFNELFWPVVGNVNLLPETSKQFDFGAIVEKKDFTFSITYFNIDLKDKIQWLPAGGSNLWRPINTPKVQNYGVECYGFYRKEIGEHNFNVSSNFTNVIAINKETLAILPYTPKYLINYKATYGYKNKEVFLQTLSQSKVYTTEDNIDFYSINGVKVYNLGFKYKINTAKKSVCLLGFKINNVTNELYYFTNLRPMPGINYNVNINYNFK